jgi:hypothetical protein
MRWLRRATPRTQVELDPIRQDALVQEIRSRFPGGAHVRHHDQVAALMPLLGDSGDGMCVAVRIVHEVADEAHADVVAQIADLNRRLGRGYALDGRNYRPLWRLAGPGLRSPLFALPCGFHPYVHLAAAVAVIGVHPRRCLRATDPDPLLARVFEVLDLTTAGWEFGGVPVDADAASLASHLITAGQQLRMAVPEPAPLPPAIRELMRRNNTTDIYDPTGDTVIGGINLGAQMRQAFLI